MKRASRSVFLASILLLGVNCTEEDAPTSPEGDLLPGTWGGENVALIIGADTSHVHFGCTNGYFSAPIHVDAQGRFTVSGSYMLRAYPIPIGPTVPAQMAGQVQGRRLTFTVAVNDTVTKELVVFGPATVVFGQEPQMGPCPICVGRKAQGARRKAQRVSYSLSRERIRASIRRMTLSSFRSLSIAD